jgi:hypothetical protein
MKGKLLSHENKCLSESLKKNKNIDKQEIYNLLDIDVINTKIKEFLIKYNLPVSTDIKYSSIIIGNSFLPSLLIDKSIRGIFDLNKFKLHNILSNQRYSKNYLDKTTQLDAVQEYIKEIHD